MTCYLFRVANHWCVQYWPLRTVFGYPTALRTNLRQASVVHEAGRRSGSDGSGDKDGDSDAGDDDP